MNKNFWKNDFLPVLIAVLTGMILAVSIFVVFCGGFKNALAAFRYGNGLGVIRNNYVAESDAETMTDAALSAAVNILGDSWSYYMDEETYEAYKDLSANQYQGIGVTISVHEETGGFLVAAVTAEGPADRAGIVVGDILLAVDGTDVTGGTTTDIRALIQADFGGMAVITVLRADGTREDISVSCEEVYNSPVDYELLEGNVGYVAIANFRAGAGAETIAAVEDLMARGAESLLFDVRSNPGGRVTELTELLDYLLPEGDIFIQTDKMGREKVTVSDENCVEMPMAVLVNATSYSAAEFFAAALREYDRAIVVGEQTTGKARSQVTIPLMDGGAVHVSRYSYLTPERVDLYEAGGLTPDEEVLLTEEEQTMFAAGLLTAAEDPQILRAIDVLSA